MIPCPAFRRTHVQLLSSAALDPQRRQQQQQDPGDAPPPEFGPPTLSNATVREWRLAVNASDPHSPAYLSAEELMATAELLGDGDIELKDAQLRSVFAC